MELRTKASHQRVRFGTSTSSFKQMIDLLSGVTRRTQCHLKGRSTI